MKKNKLKKVLMIIVIAGVAIVVFGSIVMGLWNAILPAVLGVKTITFVQAIGILVLSKILFGGGPKGGFGGGCCGPRGVWKMRMREKFKNMTPEEREKIKAAWKGRCHGGWHTEEDAEDITAETGK